MTYYTEFDLRTRSGRSRLSAEYSLKEAARTASGAFDVFLSHSSLDADVILGLKVVLEERGLRVYVDWIEDAELDRGNVSARTAATLRERMRSSRSLVYATSRAASGSRWMPWELGYFDGHKGPDMVALCPIESSASGSFVGEEYLGLYKSLEQVRIDGRLQPSVIRASRARLGGREAASMSSFVRGSASWLQVT